MAEIIIASYFEDTVGPATGLTPTIRIWEVTTSGEDLLVGAPCGTYQDTDGNMLELGDCAGSPVTRDGFYRFTFTDALGYDVTKTYIIRVDGGASLPVHQRYQVQQVSPGPWDEDRTEHLVAGTTGEALSLIRADTASIIDNLYLDADSVLNVIHTLLKLETGRTRVDPTTHTLTIYDTDCTTVLRTYKLYDSIGNASTADICERSPIVKGVGDTTTITDVC